jgi:hypothetical protein
MAELKIEYLKLDDLTPYEHNARKHQAADIEAIEKSIEEFGMCDPIGIWGKKNIIVEGHGRLLALRELGYTEVPCIRLDHLTDEQRRGYALAHNKTAELSEWDFDRLEDELKGITMDMSQFGFDVDFGEEPSISEDETEEDEWDDIENLEDHYGVPYQGNKSRIADRIIALLPKGNRLVDLFGGGGCYNALRFALRQMVELSV